MREGTANDRVHCSSHLLFRSRQPQLSFQLSNAPAKSKQVCGKAPVLGTEVEGATLQGVKQEKGGK